MPNLHEAGSAYTAPAATSGYEWLPITDKHLLAIVKDAFGIIDHKIKKYTPCSTAFKALPGGRSFEDVWTYPDIWVSYYPSVKEGDYGATLSKKHITLSKYSILMGRWTTAATLVHELAHCNGAGTSDTQAEDTLKKCMLKNLHDPSVIGKILQQSSDRPSVLA
jgi:hypothetical protein